MNYFETLQSTLFRKSSMILLSGLFMVTNINLIADVEYEIDDIPIRISPIPNVPNQDPVVANLQAVMNNTFVLPFYPGGSPYLNPIILSYNTFIGGRLAINPVDNNTILTNFSQNRFRDLTETFFPEVLTTTLAKSTDGGYSWSYGPPIEQILSLGGTISQLVGFEPTYAKNGELYALGTFADTQINIPNTSPLQGLLFSRSEDNGRNWSAPIILETTLVDSAFENATGVSITGGNLLVDPQNVDRLHVTFDSIVLPTTYFGSSFYMSSHDGGRRFSSPHEMYNMINDYEWLSEHFDPELITNPPSNQSDFYPLYGGQVLTTANLVVVDEDVLLSPILRFYPKPGSTVYTQSPADSFSDRGVVRSTDNGRYWHHAAIVADQTVFALAHDPAGTTPSQFAFIDGSLNQPTVYSPFTGRVYMAYMAGNTAVSDDPSVQQYFPKIVLNTLTNHGEHLHWSHPVQINATPTDISYAQQQAFAPNMAISKDGYVVVAYYDFRNWTGTVGENRLTTPLNVDAWLAIYRETHHHDEGSTGVGLDFIEEIRLTPQSFNGRITLLTDSTNTIAGSNYDAAAVNEIGLAFNDNNELLVTFGMTNPETLPSASTITTGYNGIQLDPNNRSNVFLLRFKFPNPSNR